METKKPAKGRFEVTWTPSSRLVKTSPDPAARLSLGSGGDQGPCLYLGPSGQRCDRPALAGGYCEIHRPGGSLLARAAPSKRILAVIAAIAGILWPVIADLVREIVRWMHMH
jgi:hypothetical protein